MNNILKEDILAMVPPVEVVNRELDEFQKQLDAGLLTEGVDYDTVSWDVLDS